MSVSFHVESFIKHEVFMRRGSGNPEDFNPIFTNINTSYVHAICEAFDWTQTPWPEPAPFRGETDYAMRASHSITLYYLAGGTYPNEELRLPDAPFANLSEEQRVAKFRHLLESSGYWCNYIPVYFAEPKWFDLNGMEFSIGSSYQLLTELNDLESILNFYMSKYPPESLIAPDSYSWRRVRDAYDVLRSGCEESIAINLPLQISW